MGEKIMSEQASQIEIDNGWNYVAFKCECEYARIITSYKPEWGNGRSLKSMGLRLSQEQLQDLMSKGYKPTPKLGRDGKTTIYSFKRWDTTEKNGTENEPLSVVGWNKKEFTQLIGDGTQVIVILEYHTYSGGTNKGGENYPGGVSFRLGAVQIVKHIEFVEKEKQEPVNLVDKFKVLAQPEGWVDEEQVREVSSTKQFLGIADQQSRVEQAIVAKNVADKEFDDDIPF